MDRSRGPQSGLIAGGVSEEIIREQEASARLQQYARLQDALFGLLLGEVDALVSFQSSVWKTVRELTGPGFPFSAIESARKTLDPLPANTLIWCGM